MAKNMIAEMYSNCNSQYCSGLSSHFQFDSDEQADTFLVPALSNLIAIGEAVTSCSCSPRAPLFLASSAHPCSCFPFV